MLESARILLEILAAWLENSLLLELYFPCSKSPSRGGESYKNDFMLKIFQKFNFFINFGINLK